VKESFEVATADMKLQLEVAGATYPAAPKAIFSQFRANASLIMCWRGEYGAG
jgi:hypothetical protein